MKHEILTLAGAAGLAVLLSGVAIAGSGQGAAKSGNPKAHSGNENSASIGGAVTSQLAGLNAAHANAIAFENAAPESMPGKLAIYMAAFSDVEDAEAALAEAEAEVARLLSLDETADEFNDEGDPLAAYLAALADAEAEFTEAEEDLAEAEDDLEDAIFALTGDTELDADVEAELHALLGI
ncbi:MAG: hypothetical protein ACU0DI_16180 [Paracoccaceae bacterium]